MLDTAPHTASDTHREVLANAFASASNAVMNCRRQIELMTADDAESLKRNLSHLHTSTTWMLEAMHAKLGSDAQLPYMGIDGTIYPTPGDHYLKLISSAD